MGWVIENRPSSAMPPTLDASCGSMSSAGAPCGACFEPWESKTGEVDGDTVTLAGVYSEAAVCPVTDKGVIAAHCSGMTLVGEFGDDCRAACARNQGSCTASAKAYCAASGNKSNYDCTCLEPAGRTWGTGDSAVSYDSQAAFIKNQGLSIPGSCVWPACAPAYTQVILQDPATAAACPDASLVCSVSGLTVSLHDIQASNIQLVDQNCGTLSTKTAKAAKSGRIEGWTQNQFVGGLAVLILAAVVLAVIVFIYVKNRRVAKAAQAEASTAKNAALRAT